MVSNVSKIPKILENVGEIFKNLLIAKNEAVSSNIFVADPPFILVDPVIGSGPTIGFKIKNLSEVLLDFSA